MRRRTRRSLIDRIEINLVHQHERTNAAGDVANFPQNRIWGKRARWIVEVCDHDEPRLRRNRAKTLSRLAAPAGFPGAQKPLHVRVKISRDIENWSVRRMLN